MTASSLLCAAAGFQIGLALGLPFGEATWGGRAAHENGVLSPGFRVAAVVSALILTACGAILLRHVRLIRLPMVSDRAASHLTVGVIASLALSTAGNLSAPHPLERYGMGALSTAVVLLGAVVARGRLRG